MGATQVELEKPRRSWLSYLIIVCVIALFVILPISALVYFREEIQKAQAYGYIGVFIVGVLCGVSIIPAPTQLLIFTFGHVLNPLYVGLVAGLGGAIGGITVYLTGAGVQTIWSKFRNKEQAFQHRLGLSDVNYSPPRSQFWSKTEILYNRLVKWVGGKRGAWALFITSAVVISPFYPAGLAAGSLHMGLLKFFLISWAGKTVRFLYVALAGYWGLQFILKWTGG